MNVQLANTYNPSNNYRVSSWYASPKFDGIRAVFIPEKGFFTRNNKPIAGLIHMVKILNDFCKNHGLSFIDGELLLKGRSFQAAQSVILSAENSEKSNIEYHVFAAGGSFINTADMLKNLPHKPDANIFRVNSHLITNSYEAVEEVCRVFTAQGYEGVMLRNPETSYSEGRSDLLLKHKFFKEADLLIIEAHEGTGKLTGTLGSLTLEGEIDGLKVRSDVGTGLTYEDRNILFADKNIKGKILTVKYQSLTDRPNSEGFYSLRFPCVIGLKLDRDFPETATPLISKAKTENFPTPSNVIYRNNGFVEAGFQVEFVNRLMHKLSYIPSKKQMAEWKSRLFQCRSIQEGIQLIADLKLTIPKIRTFARYLGVNLRGCKYLKSEIVRWLIKGSLGARIRAERLIETAKRRKKCRSRNVKHAGSELITAFGTRSQRLMTLLIWAVSAMKREIFSRNLKLLSRTP